MSRIAKAFENKKAFIAFLTGGDPNADKTVEFVFELEKAGADLIEIGIPFSDPTAEGVVIQEANIRALSNGMTTDGIFEIARRVREKSSVPLAFMTYLNPVFKYGYHPFFEKCQQIGVDGIIIPDLPYEEKKEVSEVADQYGVDVISLIAPTSEQRVQMIAKEAKGFIYLVSSMGVTGVRSEIRTDLLSIVNSIKEVTDTPCAVGFGISTKEQVASMTQIADGVIVGSAIVKLIARYQEDANQPIYEYVKGLTDQINKSIL